jgi:hypothetical protein
VQRLGALPRQMGALRRAEDGDAPFSVIVGNR